MRLTVALLLFIPGLLMMAKPDLVMPGLGLMYAGWWVFERSQLPDRDGLATAVLTLGAIGAGAVLVKFALEQLP